MVGVNQPRSKRSCSRLSVILVLLGLALFAAACSGGSEAPSPSSTAPATPAPTAGAALPNFSHIFLIVMENKEYGDLIGNAHAPYINQLAARYGLATNYYAVAHPSLPNYLALISGGTQGVTSDCTSCFQNAPNLADQLDAHHRTWKAYAESLPHACYLGANTGDYAMKHVPWLYFNDIRTAPQRCGQVVPLSQLPQDLAGGSLPDFAWITPNLCHDMHNCSVQTGDSWLASFLPSILNAPAWRQGGLILITWDEGSSDAQCCGAGSGGLVPLLVIAPDVPPGFRSATALDHYSVLRTIEDAWSLGELGKAALPATGTLAQFFR